MPLSSATGPAMRWAARLHPATLTWHSPSRGSDLSSTGEGVNRFHPAFTVPAALLPALLVACGGSPSAPSAQGFRLIGEPPPFVLTTISLTGRVVDDFDKAVAGVTVMLQPGLAADPTAPSHATTDGNGAFAFTAAVRAIDVVYGASVDVDRDGYESTWASIVPNLPTTITIYPTMTIHAGSTLHTRIVEPARYLCGPEDHRCRRIVVEPAGRPVLVEILEADGYDVGLVDDDPPPNLVDYARRGTISDGEFFIIGGPATVTLRASPSTGLN